MLGQTPNASPFNAYTAHLEPRILDGECLLENPSYFRNLTYVFRAEVYPRDHPVHLHDGRFNDSGPFEKGVIDWSTELEELSPIGLNSKPAVLLQFFANHLGGSGSASHVLIVRCAGNRLQIVFEAGGEGVRASYPADGDLQVSHPCWRADDSHASPSLVVDEQYRWNATASRFTRVSVRERTAAPPIVERYQSAVIDEQGSLLITTVDQRTIVISRAEEQVSFSEPVVSSSGTAVGAQAEFPNCCTSYPIPLQLVVYASGKVHRFTGNGLPIFHWRFADEGARVAYEQQPVHFGCEAHYELRDLETEHLVEEINVPQTCGQFPNPRKVTIPAWVRELSPWLK